MVMLFGCPIHCILSCIHFRHYLPILYLYKSCFMRFKAFSNSHLGFKIFMLCNICVPLVSHYLTLSAGSFNLDEHLVVLSILP